MKKYLTTGLLISICFSLSMVSATSIVNTYYTEAIGDIAPDQASEGCTDLSYNLTYKKSKDTNTNGEVSDLQYFLQDQGLLTSEPNGVFGPATLKAVKYFQKKNGLKASGYVGPVTRAKIKEMSCGENSGTVSTNINQGTNGKKVCKAVGSKNEGWYDSVTNELVEYAKCSTSETDSSYNNSEFSNITPSLKITSGSISNGKIDIKLSLPKKYDGHYVLFILNPIEVSSPVSSGAIKMVNYYFNHANPGPLSMQLNVLEAHEGFSTNQGGVHWFKLSEGKYEISAVVYATSPFKPGTDMEYMDIGKEPAAQVIVTGDKFNLVTSTANSPTATVTEGPSVGLNYDSTNKEVSLTAKAKVQVTAGGSNLTIVKPGQTIYSTSYSRFSVWLVEANKGSVSPQYFSELIVTSESGATDYGTNWVIPAGKTATFYISQSFNVKKMFSGSYHALPYLLDSENNNNILSAKDGNSVTIIGETSPYISGVSDVNGYIKITGARLNLSGNYLQIDGTGNSMVTKFNPTNSTIYIKKSDYAITSSLSTGFHSIKITNSQTGDSNEYGFNVEQTVPVTPVEAHGPNYNAMSCSNPAKTGLPHEYLACYGIWDYGNEFGGDPDMCPPYGYSSSQIGCKVKTKACSSGQAVATRVFNPTSMDVNSNDITVFAMNLKTSKEAVKQQIPTLWEYTCDGSGLSPVEIPTTSSVTLVNPTLVSSSPVSQYVVGGSNFGIATFKIRSSGGSATVRELRITTAGTDAITSVTVGGVTASVVNGVATVTGLSIAVSSMGTDVPVAVKFSGFQNSTTGGSLVSGISGVKVTLNYIEALNSSGSVITNSSPAYSNAMTLVASKPTVTVSNGGGSLVLGSENKIGEFTVTADANGKIGIYQTSFTVSSMGITNLELTSPRFAEGNTTIPDLSASVSGSNIVITYGYVYEIPAGTSKTFSLFATVSGTSQPGVVPRISSILTSPISFKWMDFIGSSMQYDGTLINNFPTNSFVVTSSGVSVTPTTSSSCKVVDVYAKAVPGYVFSNLYVKTSNLVATSGLPIGISGTGSWDNLTFTKDTATGDLIASQTMNSTGVSYVLGMKNNIKLVQNGEAICKSISDVATLNKPISVVLGVSTVCVDLSRNLHRGIESSSVTTLQKFLQSKGLLSEVSGFYGDKTIEAVKDYQASKGLVPTGMVYEVTRQAVRDETCK